VLEPEARGLDRAPAQRARREALPDLQAVVDGDEEALPEQTAPAERLGHAREAETRLLARDRPELVEREMRRQPLDRLSVQEHEQRHQDRPRPVRDLVDVEQEDGRGSSMISTGIVGTPFQSYSPKSASKIFVNTSALAGPPISRISDRAAAIVGSLSGTPAIFIAKYALIVADRLAGPASKRL